MNQFLAAVCGVLVVGGIALTVAGMHRAPASEATFSTGLWKKAVDSRIGRCPGSLVARSDWRSLRDWSSPPSPDGHCLPCWLRR